MKRRFFTCLFLWTILLFYYTTMYAQVTMEGSYTLSNTGGDFTSLSAVFEALNTSIIGATGISIEIEAGQVFIENNGISLNKSGISNGEIRFIKAGVGDNPLFKFAGTTSSSDFMIKLSSSDYVHFDNLDFEAINQNVVEYGIILENGCQNVQISNCSIDLKSYTNSYTSSAIYSYTNSGSMTNSNNRYLSNHIHNAQYGYYLKAYSAVYPDENNILSNDSENGSIQDCKINGVFTENQRILTISNQDISWSQAGSLSSIYGIYVSCTEAEPVEISYNTIHNLSSPGSVYGIFVSGNSLVHHNNIYQLQSTNNVYGIYSNSQTTHSFYSNTIQNLYSSSTTSAIVSGVNLSNSSTVHVYNNLITNIRAPYSTRTPIATVGIFIVNPIKAYLHYNTLVLNVSSSSNNISTCLYLSDSSVNSNLFELCNNLVLNQSSPGGGSSASIAHIGVAVSKYSSASNHNIYYSGVPSGNHLLFRDNSGLNAKQTLSAYQTYFSGRETSSYTENTEFVSSTDFHINSSFLTNVESNAISIDYPNVINTDLEGVQRNTSYSDIGCYEGDYSPITDVFPPNISFTELADTYFVSNRQLTVTINDYSGIPVEGTGLPVLYWKKNNESYQQSQGIFVGNNQYQFEFGNGVSKLDSIYYYLVVQDNVSPPNIMCYPSSGAEGFTSFPPAVSGSPSEPINYQILNSVSGDYYVGTGHDFTSFSENTDTGFFKYVNEFPLTGNTTVYVTSNLFESGEINLLQWREIGIGSYEVKIKPITDQLYTLSSLSTSVLMFENVHHLTIDGSNDNQTCNLKFMTMNQDGTGLTFSGDYSDINLTNLNFCGFNNNVNPIGISFTGNRGQKINIENSTFGLLKTGIFSETCTTLEEVRIAKNQFGSDTDHLYQNGIYLNKGNSVQIENNLIEHISSSSNEATGIKINSSSSDILISGNIIRQISANSSASIIGIHLQDGPFNYIRIINNAISNLKSGGIQSDISGLSGISVSNSSLVKIYHNSIYLNNTINNPVEEFLSAGLHIGYNNHYLFIANNLIINKTNYASQENHSSFSLYNQSSLSEFTILDYNDYQVNTGEDLIYSMQNYTTLSEWKESNDKDTHSKNFSPGFVSIDDLHLNFALTSFDFRYGTDYIDSVFTDIDGQTRNPYIPMIGCDELMHDLTLPVTLSSFTAVQISENRIMLNWKSQSETDLVGYYVYRSLINSQINSLRISNLIRANNSSIGGTYHFTDEETLSDTVYYYWLKIQNLDGSSSYHGPIICRIRDDSELIPQIPLITELKNPYPNPFNPSIDISYSLSDDDFIGIKIYNIKGQLIKTLIKKFQKKGAYRIKWDGKSSDNKACGNGIYFCIMETERDKFIKKITLMK